MTATLDYDGDIAILDLGDDENRFTPEFLDEVDALLDAVLEKGAHGLVTTADSKFYSNGLDLEWLGAHSDQGAWYVGRVQGLLARVLTFPVPTAAAVVGHAFGAGAMLAMAHDYRVMREDRGFFCFPEVDIHIPFTPGMAALIQAKLTPQAAIASMTTGRRLGGTEAHAHGIVDATAPEGSVTQTASTLLRPIGKKDQGTLGAIKQVMFGAAATALLTP
ncbi:enoyl-CoA hydratase-related protein [Mycolicibacterium goodii]|uniref:Enoyl-CoA hydratase n=1 Tax=Mycolicibacterium goodii TaxID=134601 RepID=A0A0K0X224_MYCGD|nr:enoyl-CoA hydratase [Mycolicibacterium goodii]